MSDKRKCTARIESQVKIAEGVYSMWLGFPEDLRIAGESVPGQFISMYINASTSLHM